MKQLNNKTKLLDLLKSYEKAYYSGESLISDEEYDAIKTAYIRDYGEYNFVPNEGNTNFSKIQHLYPLKSLSKYQLNDISKLSTALTTLSPMIIEPKYDGLSIEIQRPDMNSNNLLFITRGDGNIGDDVTKQCLQIPGAKELYKLFNSSNQSFRAEVMMTHTAFNNINKKKADNKEELLSNCRNAAAGMLRNLDLSKIEGLIIMIYEDLSSTIKASEQVLNLKNQINDLNLGDSIRVTDFYKPETVDEAIEQLQLLEEFRKNIDYDIDGWVVKSDIENSLEVFGGYTGHHPKNAFAVKGEAKGEWTYIKNITWQVGKQNIVPVAELNPVKIDGAVISRATLHNLSFLQAINLDYISINSNKESCTKVKVVKANDVIPKIIEVNHDKEHDSYMQKILIPKKCPVCDSDVINDNGILSCTGANCPAKLKARLAQMCGRDALNITGMSIGVIEKFDKIFELNNLTDILSATKEDILELEGYADKSATKLEQAILKAKKSQPVDKILYGSAIPLIGKSTAKDICEHYSLKELLNILNEEDINSPGELELMKVKDVGPETAKSLMDNKKEFIKLLNCIDNVIDIKKDKPANQLSFCITGQREPFKSIIEQAGHKITGSVSKKTTALINANNEQSTKADKAKALNIPIITTENELKELLGILF